MKTQRTGPNSSVVVAVNTLSVNDSNEGTKTMLQRLLRALERVAPDLEQVLICSRENRHLFDRGGHVLEVPLHGAQRVRRVAYDQIAVPRLAKGRAHVLFTPAGVAPLQAPVPQVVAVSAHLALPSCQRIAGPDGYGLWHRVYYGAPFRRALRRADAVLGISRFLADGLIRELGLDPRKVGAMPLGVDMPERSAPIGGREPLVLFVGTLYGYKDALVAVQAFARARAELPAEARLVVAGKDPGRQSDLLARAAARGGVRDAVEITGAVTDEVLEDLYARASAFVMPSRCEGFGLPVAEAMSRNVPVIVADATSLPEVAGAAGISVGPGDVAGFAEAMIAVLNDPARHRAMAEAGRARARRLNWERSAGILHNVLMRAAAAEAVVARA